MNHEYPSRIRSRAKIIAAIAELPPTIQGKICEDKRKLANGKTVTYHNLQYWADGKNHTLHIPENKLDEFKAAARNGAKAKILIVEPSCSDAQAILSGESPLKKGNYIVDRISQTIRILCFWPDLKRLFSPYQFKIIPIRRAPRVRRMHTATPAARAQRTRSAPA